MRYRRAVLIYNPAARHVKASVIESAAAALQRHVACLETIPTAGPGSGVHIARQACARAVDLIVACGGDGTINEIINGMAGAAAPLAVIPAGTANVFALETGLPLDPNAAACLLPDLVPRRIGLGLVRREGPPPCSRYFLLMSGVGLDAHIIYRLNPRWKKRFGEVAYWAAGLFEFGRRRHPFEISLEGRTYECTFALASRSRLYGGGLQIARRSHLLDASLDIVLFHTRCRWRYARYLADVLTGRLDRSKDVTFAEARRIEARIVERADVRIEVDGEYAGRLPASIEVVEDAITLLLPAAFIREDQAEL